MVDVGVVVDCDFAIVHASCSPSHLLGLGRTGILWFMLIALNGFKVVLSGQGFRAFVQQVTDPEEVTKIRADHGTEWFVHYRDGHVYGIPRVQTPVHQLGVEQELSIKEPAHLSVLSARINDCLPAKFPQYEVFRNRPFVFLGKRDEIVQKATAGWRNLPSLVSLFKIRPRFELDARLVELRDGDLTIGLFVSVNTNWEIQAPVSDLAGAGIDLTGLHVVRRNPQPGERRLVGKIAAVRSGIIELSDAYDDLASISSDKVWLEGSKASFSRCLRKLLPARYDEFDKRRDVEEGALLGGPALEEVITKMDAVLQKVSPLQLTPVLNCSITERLTLKNEGHFKTVVWLDSAQYCFDTAKTKRAAYAWVGLDRFGPYSRETFSRKSPRILVVSPDKAVGQVGQAIKAFRDGINGIANGRYEKGFSGTFHLHNPEFVTCQVPLLGAGNAPPAKLYRRAVEQHLAGETHAYDAAIIVILDEHAALPGGTNPYLVAKAILLMAGVPVQEAKLSTITKDAYNAQFVFQNIAVALYAKMGGVPWTVDQGLTVDDEIVIGMGTAELSGSRFDERQRHIGITTVFRGDGNYLLSNLSRECSYAEYPEVLKATTVDVLKEIKQRNGWRKNDAVRVVFHAFKPFKKVEIAEIVRECVRQVGADQKVEFAFLTVSHDHPFKVADLEQKGIESRHGGPRKGIYAPERGLMGQLGGYTRLLATNGPSLIKKPTAPLPSPLLVHLHPQSTYRDQRYLTEQVLKFTALSWRSTLPAHEPVTILYSEMIAGLLARLEAVENWSPSVLNTKLRYSMWFL